MNLEKLTEKTESRKINGKKMNLEKLTEKTESRKINGKKMNLEKNKMDFIGPYIINT